MNKNQTNLFRLTHEELVRDLSLVKNTPYTEVFLGSKWLGDYRRVLKARQEVTDRRRDGEDLDMNDFREIKSNYHSTPRADVVRIRPSYTRFLVDIYEVKASRADFLADVREEKWKRYLPHCHRLYFAAPKGIIDKDELDPEVGLIQKGENSWYTRKKAVSRDVEIPRETLKALIFYDNILEINVKRRRRYARNYWEDRKILRRIGGNIATAMQLVSTLCHASIYDPTLVKRLQIQMRHGHFLDYGELDEHLYQKDEDM